jgi:hypothetical protein
MNRAFCLALLLLAVGCQLPSELIPVQPIPDNGKVLDYAAVVQRARLQATAATEAFYVDRWNDLEDTARALEQTGLLLTKAAQVPEKHKAQLGANAMELVKEAAQLREAAKAKDVKRSNESLQRIHLKVREMRPES